MKSTRGESTLKELRSIDLDISQRLQDREFRREWFRAELESSVPESYRELRERRGLTQGQLAKAVGTQQPAVSRFERSTSPVWEFDFLLRLAEALDGRLRVTIEAAEDVLREYEESREAAGASSILERLAETGALTQTGRASVLDAPPSGKEGYGIKERREQQTYRIDDHGAAKKGSAISA